MPRNPYMGPPRALTPDSVGAMGVCILGSTGALKADSGASTALYLLTEHFTIDLLSNGADP